MQEKNEKRLNKKRELDEEKRKQTKNLYLAIVMNKKKTQTMKIVINNLI